MNVNYFLSLGSLYQGPEGIQVCVKHSNGMALYIPGMW